MKDLFAEAVASRLRELRAGKKLTLKEVSDISGISVDAIARYENNKNSITITNLYKLVEVYNISLIIFFKEVYAKTQELKIEEGNHNEA